MILSPLAQQLSTLKVIPVIVIDSVPDALTLGQLLIKHHLPIAEITFRTSAAPDAIRELKAHYPQLLIGAGTILSPEQSLAAKNAGADFIISPGFNIDTVNACRALNLPIIPGVNNPTAIEMALNEGIKVLKFFPAEASGGIPMIQSILAPYQDIHLIPTGGITPENLNEYLAIDRIMACGLSWMVDPKLIATGDWQTLESRLIKIREQVMAFAN